MHKKEAFDLQIKDLPPTKESDLSEIKVGQLVAGQPASQ